MSDERRPGDGLDDIVGDRLRDHLHHRASGMAPTPDRDVLDVRITRHERRRSRALAGALAIALLLGPAIGFAAGFGLADDDPDVTAVGPADRSDDPGSGGPGDGAEGSPAYGYNEVGPWAADPETVTHQFTRETDAGVMIRAYRADQEPASMFPGTPEEWTPPAECFPESTVHAGLSTEAAVGVGFGQLAAEVAEDVVYANSGWFGVAEGEPVAWTAAQVPDGIATVRVTYAGGGSDEMAPVGGVAVLAVPVPAATVTGSAWWEVSGTLEALATDGTVRASVDLLDAPVPGFWGEGCEPPPPALPEPGEQPADPDAARAEVEAAFAGAFGGDIPPSQRPIEPHPGLDDALDAVRDGQFADQIGAASAVVTEVVFTSPAEAAVRYDIRIEDWPDFPGRIGAAVLTDGNWLVTAETICADLALAGVTC